MPIEALNQEGDGVALIVAALFEHHFDELVDVMCEAVQARSPVYASLHERAGFRASIARTAQLFARTFDTGGRIGDDELTGLHLVGAERCRQGVPEAEMLDAVRRAAQEGAAFLIRHCPEVAGDTDAVARVASVVSTSTFDFVAHVQQALATGWRTEEGHPLPAGLRGRATLLDRLFDGGCSEAELLDLARAEGVDLRPPCLPLLVVACNNDAADLRALGADVAEQVPGAIEGAVRTSPVPHLPVAIGNVGNERLPAVLQRVDSAARAHGLVVVAGPLASCFDDVPRSYRQASANLAFARVERRRPGLVESNRLWVYGMLSKHDVAELVDLCLSVLGPVLRLPPAKRDELLDALEAVGEAGGSQQEAATLLGPGVNAHNVKHRLGRLERLTGLQTKVEWERLLLGLAVRAYRGWVATVLQREPVDVSR